ANTFAEISTVVAILMNNIDRMPAWVAEACFVATFLLTIASGVHYIFRASSAIASAAPGGQPATGESPPAPPPSP
ncbi:MAG TPA: hypothetical protein PK569_10320, partial [Thermoanaerobaculia bacterium]|nr:hypothetical protein [Thermoanaerobaculia bacterium]